MSSAQFAPNHKKTKPWRFRVFRGEEKQQLAKEIQKIYKSNDARTLVFREKNILILLKNCQNRYTVVTISVNFSGLLPEWEEIAATSMAVQNMYLTCTANQIGCYWSSHTVINHLGEFLNLEENQRCLGLFYLGKI